MLALENSVCEGLGCSFELEQDVLVTYEDKALRGAIAQRRRTSYTARNFRATISSRLYATATPTTASLSTMARFARHRDSEDPFVKKRTRHRSPRQNQASRADLLPTPAPAPIPAYYAS
ncbi:unnamed protein product [Peniophora sp. CBMAI 1063]|nr:unnamed protein product [Peniophora sp. CBMAI 1063]